MQDIVNLSLLVVNDNMDNVATVTQIQRVKFKKIVSSEKRIRSW